MQYNGTDWVNSSFKISSGTNGQLLQSNGTDWISVNKNTVLALSDLTNVVLTAPSTNQLLQLSGSNWVNSTFKINLPTLTAANTNQLLQYNGTDWVNSSFKNLS